MILYYPSNLFNNAYRWHIFPIIKQEKDLIALTSNDLRFTDHEEEADIIILPMSWNYYYKNELIKEVLEFTNKFENTDKKLFSFVTGDTGSKVPKSFKGTVLRASGDRSKLPKNHLGMPIFINDPIRDYYQDKLDLFRPYRDKPTLGFCGQALPSKLAALKDVLRLKVKNILVDLGYLNINKQPLISTSYLRYRILNSLQGCSSISDNFILRNNYRAGVKEDKSTHASTYEFYDNIKNSDYTICVRGAGNFSNRFYETLAMGRIPVLIDTDCILPLTGKINWKNHILFVNYDERNKIAEKITSFHKNLNEEKLNNLFEKNRLLWHQHLKLLPYFEIIFNEV